MRGFVDDMLVSIAFLDVSGLLMQFLWFSGSSETDDGLLYQLFYPGV